MKKGGAKEKSKEAPSRFAQHGTVSPGNHKSQKPLGVTDSMESTCAAQQYVIVKLLGTGSYGTVYVCKALQKHRSLQNTKFALKVIDTLKADKQYVEKFLKREFDILLRVKHPYIIEIRSMVHRNNKFYIFMRYAEQGDLLGYLVKEGRVAENRARLWGGQIALALRYLHTKNIAHRDIKCENILITSHGNTKLTDFGFATFYTVKNGKPSPCTTYCGTRHYASPEILSSTPYDPEKTDVWAYGVVLYVMLNGSLPFPSNITKKIQEYQRRGNVQMKPGIKVSEEALFIFQNIFELNPYKRWGTEQLLAAEWFRSGVKLKRAGKSIENARYFDQSGMDDGTKELFLLMGGDHQIVLPPMTSSHFSENIQIPAFMVPSRSVDMFQGRSRNHK